MLAFNRRTKIYVCKGPTDMRASYDTLVNKTRVILEKDPFSGHLFLFINRKRNSCKALFYDGTGLLILSKRLESGTFTDFNWILKDISLTQAEFGLFLEGADLSKRFIESPKEIKKIIFSLEIWAMGLFIENEFIYYKFTMKKNYLFETTPVEKYDNLNKKEMIELLQLEEKLRLRFQRENQKLKSEIGKKEQLTLSLDEKYILLRDKLFGKSSEKSRKKKEKGKGSGSSKKRRRLPSDKFPNLEIKEIIEDLDELPHCGICGNQVCRTGLKEISEKLTIIPKRYLIERYLREKYKCNSCEYLKAAPMPAQIVPGVVIVMR